MARSSSTYLRTPRPLPISRGDALSRLLPLLPFAFALALLAQACAPEQSTQTTDPPSTASSHPQKSAGPQGWFREVEDWREGGTPSGVWPDGTYSLLETMGPGLALGDLDGDGDLDLVAPTTPPPSDPGAPAAKRVFLLEDPDTLRYRLTEPGISDLEHGQAVALADIDGDADLDIFFGNYGPDSVYRNRGDGTFEDATPDAWKADDRWSTAAAFCDYDADGDLDLYVAHYVHFDPDTICSRADGAQGYCGPQPFRGVQDSLYRNDGTGRFEDVTERAGIRLPNEGARAKGLGVVCTDLTGDGRLDFYVANDGENNQLWVNSEGRVFREEALARGVAVGRTGDAEASMGVAVGDVDDDGTVDLFMTHLKNENNTLYRGLPDLPLYEIITLKAGMAASDFPLTGFGCGLQDLDLDGDLDAVVVNGQVYRRDAKGNGTTGSRFWDVMAEPDLVFENLGGARFRPMEEGDGKLSDNIELTRGLAWGDLDGDGDLDLATSSIDGGLRIFLNEAPAKDAHWLKVRAWDGPIPALGAKVVLEHTNGRLLRLLLAHQSYQSTSEAMAHFGLGNRSEYLSLAVQWADGSWEQFPGGAASRVVHCRRGEGKPLATAPGR